MRGPSRALVAPVILILDTSAILWYYGGSMDTSTKFGQKLWDGLISKLLCNIRNNTERVTYTSLSNQVTLCQIHMKNGFVVEGYAKGGPTPARKDATRQLLLVEQYLEAERLYRETDEGKTQPSN